MRYCKLRYLYPNQRCDKKCKKKVFVEKQDKCKLVTGPLWFSAQQKGLYKGTLVYLLNRCRSKYTYSISSHYTVISYSTFIEFEGNGHSIRLFHPIHLLELDFRFHILYNVKGFGFKLWFFPKKIPFSLLLTHKY